jgi:hypothetical protein
LEERKGICKGFEEIEEENWRRREFEQKREEWSNGKGLRE